MNELHLSTEKLGVKAYYDKDTEYVFLHGQRFFKADLDKYPPGSFIFTGPLLHKDGFMYYNAVPADQEITPWQGYNELRRNKARGPVIRKKGGKAKKAKAKGKKTKGKRK